MRASRGGLSVALRHGFGALVLLSGSFACASTPVRPPRPAAPCAASSGPSPPSGSAPQGLTRGTCNLERVPPQLLLDLSDAEAAGLLAFVQQWIAGERAPSIAWRSGIAFAKSADDSGADPPYPTVVGAQSVLACGLSARWLRSHLARELEERSRTETGVVCEKNVCCWPARMEFDSGGIVIFARAGHDASSWTLRAAAQAADNGAMTSETVAANRAEVRQWLETLSQRTCEGEPVRPYGE